MLPEVVLSFSVSPLWRLTMSFCASDVASEVSIANKDAANRHTNSDGFIFDAAAAALVSYATNTILQVLFEL